MLTNARSLVPKQAIGERAKRVRDGGWERAQVSGPVSRERDRVVGMGIGSLGRGAKGLTRGLREPKRVAQTWQLAGVEESEEDRQVRAPGEQTDDERAAVPRDLGREQHEALQEGAEFHAENA